MKAESQGSKGTRAWLVPLPVAPHPRSPRESTRRSRAKLVSSLLSLPPPWAWVWPPGARAAPVWVLGGRGEAQQCLLCAWACRPVLERAS